MARRPKPTALLDAEFIQQGWGAANEGLAAFLRWFDSQRAGWQRVQGQMPDQVRASWVVAGLRRYGRVRGASFEGGDAGAGALTSRAVRDQQLVTFGRSEGIKELLVAWWGLSREVTVIEALLRRAVYGQA